MTYWEERFLNLKERGLNTANETYEDLTSIYAYSLEKYENQIAGFIQRYATNNQISLADARKQLSARELKAFRLTLQQYVKLAQQKDLSPKQIRLLENASIRARLTRLEELWIHTSQFVELLAAQQHTNINDHSIKYLHRRTMRPHISRSNYKGNIKHLGKYLKRLFKKRLIRRG